jgi:hypothetical protein
MAPEPLSPLSAGGVELMILRKLPHHFEFTTESDCRTTHCKYCGTRRDTASAFCEARMVYARMVYDCHLEISKAILGNECTK